MNTALSLNKRGKAQKRTGGRIDMRVLVLLILLLLTGLVSLFSASYYNFQDSGDAFAKVRQQLAGVALGAAALALLCRVDYHFYKRPVVVLVMLAVSALLLTLVCIPGIGVLANGSRRWLRVGGMSFQPSEVAKFAMVIFMANALDNKGARIRSFWGLIPPLIIPGAMFLLILQQPNLSTAGSILIVAFVMVAVAGARVRHLTLMGAAGLALGAFYAWSEPYRRERLLSFRDPFKLSSRNRSSQSAQAGFSAWDLGRDGRKRRIFPIPNRTSSSPPSPRISGFSAALRSLRYSCCSFMRAFASRCAARIDSAAFWRPASRR